MGETKEPQVQALGLYAKLAAVMSEVGYVQKKGVNQFHRYKYVTEQDLLEAVREKLSTRNVALIPSVTTIDDRPVTSDKGKQSTITTVTVAFTFCDGDSGQTHTAEWAGRGDDPSDKGLYKAYAGAMKYFLMKSFLIPTGDDPEADEKTDQRSAGGQARTQAPPAAPSAPPAGQGQVDAVEYLLAAILGMDPRAIKAAEQSKLKARALKDEDEHKAVAKELAAKYAEMGGDVDGLRDQLQQMKAAA